MRWLFVLVGAVALAAVAAVVIVLPSSSERPPAASPPPSRPATSPAPKASEFTDPCGTFETDKEASYAVTGYWITPKSNPCTWRHQLQEIHRVGGDTIIRIGYGLQYRSVRPDDGAILLKDESDVDPLYRGCEAGGLSCTQLIDQALKKAAPGNRVSRTYVYRTDEAFGKDLFRCPGMERTVDGGKRVYYLVVTPEDGSDPASCDFGKGQKYDLIVIAGSPPGKDSLGELLDLADRFDMRVYPALPLAPRDPKTPTRANPKHLITLTTLTRRILQDYGLRFAQRASLGGVYQPFEVQMGATLVSNPTLDVYATQHKIVEQELPGKDILISPYLDARKRVGFGQTPAQVAEAFKALARTGVGIIAPQDSRGTGKVGLFWPDERDDEVDERLRPVVGESTYGTAYHGSTRDYYREMAQARRQMLQEGHEVQLWANVEAFEPSGDRPCAPQGTRGKTDKKRLDQAVAMAGRYVQKIVSYMWSDFLTCGSPSLEEEIRKDWTRPIAVDAIRRPRDVQDGVEVRGYSLKSGTVTVEWSGGVKELNVAAEGWFEEYPVDEQDDGMEALPDGMQTAWVPFDWAQVPAGEWVRIGVKSDSGLPANELLHVRITT
ncbi:DUF4434 domain-containing protein [Nonomuraea sp. NN258]|uniref:DUF4434 domain-containing protein n=1 Tax=Nonomuraea antri TaxID=2730852 RepID=UPI00156A587B|nr:DUF4434 domain-containing protein [Nonomuraea antri]NRQ32302.1 DUF4434 domain-containing protein [Nonomuraea antri]